MIYFFKKQNGVSLVEILLSTVIFSIAVVGVFTTVARMRQTSTVSEHALEAAQGGRQILDELRGQVVPGIWDSVASTWNVPGGALDCDSPPPAAQPLPAGLVPASITAIGGAAVEYVCEDIPVGAANPIALRRVTLTITW